VSRWGIDPPDDNAYDVNYDGTACEDCGRPSVEWLCETCSDRRDAHTSALEQRLTQQAVVDVALVALSETNGVVEVALVPREESVRVLTAQDGRELKRMVRAFLSADLSNVKDVA
jgi:hypothetical protein